jgi:lipopolysaccharide transport system ATP-binding protein
VSDIAIRVENLSKTYNIVGSKAPYKTLRESLATAAAIPIDRLRHSPTSPGKTETIWALKDVSFEIGYGEAVGIIGRNGAGKSTLLKVLSRITRPTRGRAEIHGRVGSLLEVGTGFHPELTGRENIYLNGTILGMRKAEIARQFDEIVAFAEIEPFLDTPVKRYSSGMYVRLAFAVAAHLEPEILLVDEVLAVGDAAFQKKCLGRMGDVTKAGRTVLFVSHNMGAINRLCPRSLWIDGGRLRMAGGSQELISAYLMSGALECGKRIWETGVSNAGTDEFKLLAVTIKNQEHAPATNLPVNGLIEIGIKYRISKSLPYCRVGFLLTTVDGIVVFETYDTDETRPNEKREPADYMASCQIPPHLLNPGRYVLSVNAGIPDVKNLVSLENVMALNVEDTEIMGPHAHLRRAGVIRPKLEWTTARCS